MSWLVFPATLVLAAAVTVPPPMPASDSILLEPGKSAVSYPTEDAVAKVGTRGFDAFKAICIEGGRTVDDVAPAATGKNLRKATDDELRQVEETQVQTRLPVVASGAWIGKIDEADYWVFASERGEAGWACSVFAPPGVQSAIEERMKAELGVKFQMKQKAGKALLAFGQSATLEAGVHYVGQRSSFPAFNAGAAADLFHFTPNKKK